MKAYKGLDRDFKCRGFQYEVGKGYSEEDAEICRRGFHAYKNPMDVFAYYFPAESRYCEVDLDGNGQEADDSNVVGKHIEIMKEIGLADMVKAGIEYVMQQVEWGDGEESNAGDRSAASNTGDYSVASNTGDRSAASNTGDYSVASNAGDYSVASNAGYGSVASNAGYGSVASNTGHYSAASNTGDRSVASNTGYGSVASNTGNRSAASNTGRYSAASVEGMDSVAIALGRGSRAKGSIGCFLVLAEWDGPEGECHIKEMKTAKVDGVSIMPDTFYVLKNGEFTEAWWEGDAGKWNKGL